MSCQLDFLTDVYTEWCNKEGLELISADDQLYCADGPDLTLRQRVWLSNFIEVWDVINQNT